MSDDRFESGLAFVLKWEGSQFTNDPDDHGGATRLGVTQRVYDAYRRRLGQALQSVKFITMPEVRSIYRRGYWAPVQADRMPAPLDLVLFDTGVLMGVGRAARLLQASLGVSVDGVIGSGTLGALGVADPLSVAREVAALREGRLRRIAEADPSQRKFLRGWLNRLNDLRRLVGIPAPEAALEAAAAGGGGSGDADDASVGSEEEAPTGPAGRAERDLPEDENEGRALGGAAPPGFGLLVPAEPAVFLTGSRGLLDGAGQGAVFVLDARSSSEEVLRAFPMDGGPGAQPFDIPTAAVETVTPLGVQGASPELFLAIVDFRPGFESLAGTLRRLTGAGGGGAAAEPSVSSEAGVGFGFQDLGGDQDPAAPLAGELSEVADLDTARMLANLGAGIGIAEAMELEAPQPEAAAPATLPINMSAVQAFLNACMTSNPRVTYGLGAKVPFFNAVPRKDFKKVDCSGFVREAIRRATTPRAPFPDGSVVQHEWVRARGFRKSNVQAAFKKDGAVRIAFLRPQDAKSGIGHVVLVHNARTVESHGKVGPNSRPWTGTDWQAKAFVYRLTDPTA